MQMMVGTGVCTPTSDPPGSSVQWGAARASHLRTRRPLSSPFSPGPSRTPTIWSTTLTGVSRCDMPYLAACGGMQGPEVCNFLSPGTPASNIGDPHGSHARGVTPSLDPGSQLRSPYPIDTRGPATPFGSAAGGAPPPSPPLTPAAGAEAAVLPLSEQEMLAVATAALVAAGMTTDYTYLKNFVVVFTWYGDVLYRCYSNHCNVSVRIGTWKTTLERACRMDSLPVAARRKFSTVVANDIGAKVEAAEAAGNFEEVERGRAFLMEYVEHFLYVVASSPAEVVEAEYENDLTAFSVLSRRAMDQTNCPAVKQFLNWQGRRTYKGYVNEMEGGDPAYFNLFTAMLPTRGLTKDPLKPEELEELSLIIQHVREVGTLVISFGGFRVFLLGKGKTSKKQCTNIELHATSGFVVTYYY